MSDKQQTLFDRIGGEDAVERLVDAFYQRVLDDDELAPFFAHAPMEKLIRMQREFFAAALEGPVKYTGRPISEAHFGRGIETRHLRRFLDHLLETLKGYPLEEDEVFDIISRVNVYSDEITGGAPFSG